METGHSDGGLALGGGRLCTSPAFPHGSRVAMTLMYLAMGWGAVLCYFEVARRVSHRNLLPIVVGGVLYSSGAVINLLHQPVLWPGVFQAHELFHIFVVAGSLAHYWFMLTVDRALRRGIRSDISGCRTTGD